MIADIFITTKYRPELFKKSLESLYASIKDRSSYRLTIVRDGNYFKTDDISISADYILTNSDTKGLGPSINGALAFIDSLKRWDKTPVPLTIYLQDDVQYTEGWLTRLAGAFFQFEKIFNLGFASGIECVEHPIKRDVGNGIILKDWIRATCMMARHEYWMSMFPISRIDPETGRERGRPHDGLGSSVDWWFIRNHQNSVCRTGRTNLVIPGLMQHMGYNQSTWLSRELPESENDLKKIRGY